MKVALSFASPLSPSRSTSAGDHADASTNALACAMYVRLLQARDGGVSALGETSPALFVWRNRSFKSRSLALLPLGSAVCCFMAER